MLASRCTLAIVSMTTNVSVASLFVRTRRVTTVDNVLTTSTRSLATVCLLSMENNASYVSFKTGLIGLLHNIIK